MLLYWKLCVRFLSSVTCDQWPNEITVSIVTIIARILENRNAFQLTFLCCSSELKERQMHKHIAYCVCGYKMHKMHELRQELQVNGVHVCALYMRIDVLWLCSGKQCIANSIEFRMNETVYGENCICFVYKYLGFLFCALGWTARVTHTQQIE